MWMGTGSPPHTWRIPHDLATMFGSGGITSTYVENTSTEADSDTDDEDHLHIRGEYSFVKMVLFN